MADVTDEAEHRDNLEGIEMAALSSIRRKFERYETEHGEIYLWGRKRAGLRDPAVLEEERHTERESIFPFPSQHTHTQRLIRCGYTSVYLDYPDFRGYFVLLHTFNWESVGACWSRG